MMTTTHDSIADAVSSYCNQPEVCRRPTQKIDPLTLEQLRAQSAHGLSIRNRRPTERTIAPTPPLGAPIPVEDAVAAMGEFARPQPTTRRMAQDEIENVRRQAAAELLAYANSGRRVA